MKEERRKRMEAMLAQQGSVTMEALRDAFGVSMNTVRSDVAYLVDSGVAEKVYGGVRILRHEEVPLFTQRTELRPDVKRRIAQRAERLILDQDILYIDSGSTTLGLIDCLDPGKHVTILTGNLALIPKAYPMPNVELIVLPGVMNRRTNSVSDVSTLEFLGRYHCAKAFMGATGVSPDGKLNVSTYIEYELKKLAIQQSLHSYLLVDSSKFGLESLMAYGSLSQMETVITDSGCPLSAQRYCRERGIPLELVEA